MMIIKCYRCDKPATGVSTLDAEDLAPTCARHESPDGEPQPLPRIGPGMHRGLREVIRHPGRTLYGMAKVVAGREAVKAGYPAVHRLIDAGLITQCETVDGRPTYEATPLGHRITLGRVAR